MIPHEIVLTRFRVELYTAAQIFKGEDLEGLRALVRELGDFLIPLEEEVRAVPPICEVIVRSLCNLFGVAAGEDRNENLIAEATAAKGASEGLAEVAMLVGVDAPGERPSAARVVGVVRGLLSSLAHADAMIGRHQREREAYIAEWAGERDRANLRAEKAEATFPAMQKLDAERVSRILDLEARVTAAEERAVEIEAESSLVSKLVYLAGTADLGDLYLRITGWRARVAELEAELEDRRHDAIERGEAAEMREDREADRE